MGKFCARSKLKPEMGLYCLNDYVEILKFSTKF